MRPALLLPMVLCGVVTVAAQPPVAPEEPTPQTVGDFQAAASRVLQDAGVPGAGISLVRADGVEWEGGIGFADRDRRIRATADTHFRVGSISKTLIAIAIVQMYYDDVLALEDTIEELAPEIEIDNPWHDTDPVRVIHLLQHSAGFDDMHLNEVYNLHDPADLPLLDVLQRNPNSRRVRWPPGTRTSYSNPGYAVAGYLIEKLSDQPYEDYIEREILLPLQMTTSSFRLRREDERLLAQGYGARSGPPTGFPQIYLRPAGNLHTSARQLGQFVRMLLNWGELDDEFIIDPEYLSNMERSSTTLAAKAGVRMTYGSGLCWDWSQPYPVIGHGGGIEGFVSTFGYSPARDAGYVILLNSSAPEADAALRRLSSLAIRFLKRDVEPPVKAEITVDASILDRYVGYYEDANPRRQILWPARRLLAGRTVTRDGDHLYLDPLFGSRARLVPVTETMFRRDDEHGATMVFTPDSDGTMVLTGVQLYAERRPRWRVELWRIPVLATIPILLSPLVIAILWLGRRRYARPRGFWDLKTAVVACPVVLGAPGAALLMTSSREWGTQNAATVVTFLASLSLPTLAIVIAALAVAANSQGGSRPLVSYAFLVALAAAGLSVYLWANGLIGLRLWSH